jgi:hypothetical protein
MKPARTRKKPRNARFRPFRQKSDALYAPWCPSVESSAVLPLVESPRWQGGGKAREGVRGLVESDPRLVPAPAFRRAGFERLISASNRRDGFRDGFVFEFSEPPEKSPLTAGMCLGMVVVDH